MLIRQLKIVCFRGIYDLDWKPKDNFVCLVGPGDSGKSTILDAVELVLSPRWNPMIDDSDFHGGDSSQLIEIEATLAGVPDELLFDGRFGLEARGWNVAEQTLHDEPVEGDELVLTIRLRVDASLEPTWTVTNERNPEGKPISARDREKLGVAQLGSYVDRHLTWGKGTVLSRFTGKTDDLAAILASANRSARTAVQGTSIATLVDAATRAQKVGKGVGVSTDSNYFPRLDVQSLTIGQGGFSLHDGAIPVRRAGLGTRRLLSLALQRELVRQGGVALLDEVESGLEPHRVRRLLQVLREGVPSGDPVTCETFGQILMTTHSPVVVQELTVSELRIVRRSTDKVEVIVVPEELQNIVRKAPEAFLGSRILVCEGKTEVGVCRALDTYWGGCESLPPLAFLGTVPVDGNGSEAPVIATAFRDLGYDVAYWGDSDVKLNPSPDKLAKKGIATIVWADDLATEERVANDLPWDGVHKLLKMVEMEHGKESVHACIENHLDPGIQDKLSTDSGEWRDSSTLREAIGKAAKLKSWFKRIDLGEELGVLITSHIGSIPGTDLARKLKELRRWAHGS